MIDEQLREIGRLADEHPITVDEVMQRASQEDLSVVTRPSRMVTERRRRGAWLLTGAAVVVLATVLVVVLGQGEDPEVRTDVIAPGPAGFVIGPGSIAFAADAGAGPTFTDPIEYSNIELLPKPMDIYITRAGEPARRLVSTSAHERCPAFSPDGKRLAYLSSSASGADPSILVLGVSADGAIDPSDPELQLPLPAAPGYGVKLEIGYPCPEWSPDGRHLAYLTYPVDPEEDPGEPDGADVAELRVSTLDGTHQVVNPGRMAHHDSPFAWSPDGSAVAYARDDGVWAARLDGTAPSLIWRPEGTPTAVSWSSRGELAITVRTEVQVDGGLRDDNTVHLVEVSGDSEALATTIHVYDRSAAWSPDGSRVAFVSQGGEIRANEIVVTDREDGATVRLPPPRFGGDDITLWDVAWSPDGGRLLALTRSEVLGLSLVSLSTDGSSVDVITPWSWALDWINLRDVSWHPIADG